MESKKTLIGVTSIYGALNAPYRENSNDMGYFAYTIIRLGIGGVFIWAGISKLLEPSVFAVLIDAFGIVPASLLMPIAILLPLLEILAGAGLLFEIRASLSTITALLFIFIVILSYALFLGLDIDCGCFGPLDPEAKAFHGLKISLYRDLIMLSGVLFLYLWRLKGTMKPLKHPEPI